MGTGSRGSRRHENRDKMSFHMLGKVCVSGSTWRRKYPYIVSIPAAPWPTTFSHVWRLLLLLLLRKYWRFFSDFFLLLEVSIYECGKEAVTLVMWRIFVLRLPFLPFLPLTCNTAATVFGDFSTTLMDTSLSHLGSLQKPLISYEYMVPPALFFISLYYLYFHPLLRQLHPCNFDFRFHPHRLLMFRIHVLGLFCHIMDLFWLNLYGHYCCRGKWETTRPEIRVKEPQTTEWFSQIGHVETV